MTAQNINWLSSCRRVPFGDEETPESAQPQTEEAPEPTEDPTQEASEEPTEEPSEEVTEEPAEGGDAKTGNFVDPDTNKPLIDKGDEVVYLNYVSTNTGTTEIPLAFNFVDVQARYADWKWAQGMDSIADSAIEERLGVSSSAFALNVRDARLMWLPGEQFAQGTNFKYQAGSELNFKVTLTQASAESSYS